MSWDTTSRSSAYSRFLCQKCWNPLQLDSSFLSTLDEHTRAELSLPAVLTPDLDFASQVSSLDVHVPPQQDKDNPTQGFTLLGHTNVKTNPGNLSYYLGKSAELFDLVSSTSDIDHPLCQDCADSLISLLDQQLAQAEEECKEYKQFLVKIKKESEEENVTSVESLEKELAMLVVEETNLKHDLKKLQVKEAAILKEIEQEETEKQKIIEEEEQYWKAYSIHKHRQLQFIDEQISLECQLQFAKANLERLKQTNVFNAAFHIWPAQHFGTINGLRLGRLPSCPVEWSEINAAWGQVTLLLSSLAKKVGMTFQRYKLVPYGNQSYIEDMTENKILPLYFSSGFRFLWDSKFDAGMVAFLDCLQQFQNKVESRPTADVGAGRLHFQFPYRMDKGRIEDRATRQWYSIKIQFNSEEHWTKALKFMLTNLKWGVAWVAAQDVRSNLTYN
nr:EOG090X048D [Eulimnadia texana]